MSAGDATNGPSLFHWAAAGLSIIGDVDPDPPTQGRWVPAQRSIGDPEGIAYYLCHAPFGTTAQQLVLAGRRWAVEDCFGAAKNDCGLDQYEVCRYTP